MVQRLAAALYGAELDWGAREVYLVRVLGTFALFVGLTALVAARQPVRRAGLTVALAVLFLIRTVSRHLHGIEVREGFSVSPVVNALTSAFFGSLAIALLVLLRASRRHEAVTPPPAGPPPGR